MPALITSRANPKIKQARALRQRKEREATGLFLVEGITHVAAALEAGAALVDYLCYAPDLLVSPFAKDLIAQAAARNIPCYSVATDVFESLPEKDNPTGLLAIAHQPTYNLQSLVSSHQSWHSQRL